MKLGLIIKEKKISCSFGRARVGRGGEKVGLTCLTDLVTVRRKLILKIISIIPVVVFCGCLNEHKVLIGWHGKQGIIAENIRYKQNKKELLWNKDVCLDNYI